MPRLQDSRTPRTADVLGPRPLIAGALAVVLVVLVAMLNLCSVRDDVNHVEAGDYVRATGYVTGDEDSQPTEAKGEPAQTVTDEDSGTSMRLLDEGRVTSTGSGRVSVAVFGETIIGNTLLSLADGWSGETDDGSYDFSPLYANVRSTVADAYDVSVTEAVGTLGGEDAGYSGYPLYNTPDSLAAALASVGFRVVNVNNGHVFDCGSETAANAVTTWATYNGLLAVGSYANETDAETVRVVECNGVRIAFLSYSTSQSSASALTEDRPTYLAVPAAKDTIASDVERARSVADAVVVVMHWGNDGTHEVSSEQQTYAQACADANVDVVVGMGSREIQPVTYLERADGGQMLCAYGLGALVSSYSSTDEVLSGMLSFDVVKADDGTVSVEDATWHPLVEHREGTEDAAYFLAAYTEEQAAANELFLYETDAYASLESTTREVVGSEVDLDL